MALPIRTNQNVAEAASWRQRGGSILRTKWPVQSNGSYLDITWIPFDVWRPLGSNHTVNFNYNMKSQIPSFSDGQPVCRGTLMCRQKFLSWSWTAQCTRFWSWLTLKVCRGAKKVGHHWDRALKLWT
jgi:hypothetical protein